MPASSLRRWLRRQPHPAKLRVDGREVAVATGSNQWAATEETVLALNPSKVEALDANGVMLRAMTVGDRDDDDDSDKPRAPVISELAQLAQLLNDSADKAAQRHAAAYELAFTKMVGLLEMGFQRLGSLEGAWQKAMHQTALAQSNAVLTSAEAQAALAQAQQGSGDPASDAIQALIMQAMMAKGGMGGLASMMNGAAGPAHAAPPAPKAPPQPAKAPAKPAAKSPAKTPVKGKKGG